MLLNMVMFKVTICDFGKMNINMTDNLATLYGVETKRLNEQVKRNIKRFPEDFMFQLTKDDV